MASACVNNIGMSPDNFLDCAATFPSYSWLSPRVSFSRELPDRESSMVPGPKHPAPAAKKQDDAPEPSDPEMPCKDVGDFEFRLEDPVKMLPADELFADGKLMPLQLSIVRQAMASTVSPEISLPETSKARRILEVCNADPYLFSPKAPRCSSRWKEILGLKKLHLNNNSASKQQQDSHRTSSSLPSHHSTNSKSLKHLLHRCSKSGNSALDSSSLILPLLKDSDSESVSISSSRLSLSSSSSGHEHDDLPRLSLDSEKPNLCHNPPIALPKIPNPSSNPPRVRVVKYRSLSSDNTIGPKIGQSPMRRLPDPAGATVLGVTADSPRMNSSGKIVFQGLERSSSSPSSLNGGPRFKNRGMERSYSANVRITPVLNVPVGSLSKSSVFGFQLFSSPQKREVGGGAGGVGVGGNRSQQSNSKIRTDRAA